MKTTASKSPGFSFCGHRPGFTLVELAVVVAVIPTLMTLRLPALANAKGKAQTSLALHNLEQLTRCWTLYALDNNDKLVPNNIISGPAWALNSVLNLPGLTNLNDIRNGLLFKYNRSEAIYRCPADLPRGIGNSPSGPGSKYLCVRTFSMNGRMNSDVNWVQGTKYPDYRKLSDINKRSPSSNLVFIEENPYTLDDIYFAIPVGTNPSIWMNSPATHHDGDATGLSFADGHVEMWHWAEPTTPKIKILYYASPKVANDPDLKRLQNVILIRD